MSILRITKTTMDLAHGLAQCLVFLLLTVLPGFYGQQWVKRPENQSVRLGGNVTIHCEVANLGDRQVVWNKGSSLLFINDEPNSNLDPRYSISGQYNLVIIDVHQTDDDFFSCNVFGFETIRVKLNVLLPPGPPLITYNTSSLSQLVENTVISLTCSSTGGKPTPVINWWKNGQLVADAIFTPADASSNVSSSQIIVTLDHSDHNSNYSCVVNNSVNHDSPAVDSRVLLVQYAPIIHFEPTYNPFNVKLNTNVTVMCVVDANPPVSEVSWMKNGQPILGRSKHLQFPSIQKTDTGNYRCTARNVIDGNQRSRHAEKSISVIYAPVVTTSNTVTANISTLVNLSCEVDANPPAYQIRWEKEGGTLQNNGPNLVFMAQKSHIGNYTCTARSRLEPSGGRSDDISSQGYTAVFVRYPPGQASISPTSAVLVGQEVKLVCTVDDPGYPLPVYEWRKLGEANVLQKTLSPTYVISRSTLQHNGNYTCMPENMMGQGRRASILVEVNAPPYFVRSSPANLDVTIPISQSNFQLQHVIEGRPLPSIEWIKDGNLISGMRNLYDIVTTSTVSNFKYTVTTTLKFIGPDRDQNSLQVNDIGSYSCRAAADGSSPATRIMEVSVEFAPQITVEPRVASDVSQNARLVCHTQANPRPQVTWYKAGGVVSTGPRVSMSLRKVDGIATYEGQLEIRSVTQTDFGEYSCEVNNTKGSSRKSIRLSVKSRPERPKNLSAVGKSWESVNLRWEPGFDGGHPQAFHILINSVHGETTQEVLPVSSTRFNVTRLMPHTSYTFRVYGENALGKGSNSEQFTAQTDLLVFPALSEVPKFVVNDQQLKIPNNLNDSYCLRVDVSNDGGRTWLNKEQCAVSADGAIALSLQTATNVNVSVCLQYRKEVCGEPVSSEIEQTSTSDLTETQVIIIGCVCAAILIILLIILIVIICRRRQRKNNYQNQPSTHSPRTIQPVNGAAGNPKPIQRGLDNPGMNTIDGAVGYHSNLGSHSNSGNNSNPGTLTRSNHHPGTNVPSVPSLVAESYGVEVDSRFDHHGYPIPYQPADLNLLETSYDSQMYDKRYEYEMNRRNANTNGDPYFDKPGDISFVSSPSPQTPTKDPKQFINVPEERKGEGGSGNESGYSTPDPAKPKKVIYEVVV